MEELVAIGIHLLEEVVDLEITVLRIADDGMADVGKVDTELVGPSCQKLGLDQGVSGIEGLDAMIDGVGFLAAIADCRDLDDMRLAILLQREVDRSIPLDPSGDKEGIFLLDVLSFPEETDQFVEGQEVLSEKDDFAMDQQCLWVTSEWLFAHQCKEGIEYCRQLANFALQTNTQHSLRLFGSIWWEITLDLLPSAIDAMQQKRAPDAQQALATAIGRLLRICPRDSKWSQMVQNWAKLGCASYAREVRGDVGSWTRSATLSCMNDLLYPFAVDLGSLKWTGFATVGTICEDEPLNVFFPLSLGSCLFPDGRSWGLKEEEKKKKVGEENEVVDCFVKLALKQLMEQHTKIRQLAADLLFGLDRTTPLIQMVVGLIPPELQNSSLASMPSLMKCLIHAVKLSELRPTLLRGLIYTVGGNTPTVTEEMSKELIEVIGDDAVAKEVLAELVVILKEEASAHRNGFYPALRTLILCCESVDLGAVLGAELQLELYRLIPKLAVWQAKNKNTAVMKSLLDLYALLLPLWTPDRSILAKALPFLEYPNPAIRSEAAQVLYMHLSMNGLDPEAQAVLEGGSFGSANYKDSVAALRKLCSSFSVCSNKQAR